jgi:YVTN family beta-propeller protein
MERFSSRLAEFGYLVLRLGVAFLFIFHAPQKLFGWWNSPAFPLLSLRGLACAIEIVVSPLIAVGLFTSYAALFGAAEMVGAYYVVHRSIGSLPIGNRGELAVLYFFVFIYLFFRGDGEYSLGHLMRTGTAKTASAVLFPGLTVAAVILVAPTRNAPPPSARIYVTNEEAGTLTVINADTQAVITTALLGKRPRGIKVSPDQKFLYVALSGSPAAGPGVDEKTLPPPDRSADGIGEVDVDTYQVKRIIHSGTDPEQIAISNDGTRLYVANEDAAQLSVVDLKTGNVIASVKVGDEPEGVTMRPDGKVVYVTSEGDGAVFAVDTVTNQLLKRIEVGHRPRGIAFLPDSSRGYVTLENDGAIAVIDSLKHEFLQLIPLGGHGNTPQARPMGIAVKPDSSMIFVTTGSFGALFFVDPVKNQAVASIPVGQRPWGVAVLPDGKTAYTANGPSNDVSVVDLDKHEVIKKIAVGDRPWGIGVVVRR